LTPTFSLVRRAALPLLLIPFCAALALTAFASGGSGRHVSGTLRSWHGDTPEALVAAGLGVDSPTDGPVPLTGAPSGATRLVGRKVDARGVASGNGIALAGGTLQATGSASVAAATGTKTVAVLLFNFSDDQRQPWTAPTVRNVVFDGATSVNAYYQDASYGKLSVSGDVYGWFTIDTANSGCNYTTWASQARSKAQAAGVPLGNYTYTVYAFPSAPGCGWSGLAYLPGTSSWINGSMTLRTVGHELGHNFGVHHASTLSCTDAVGTRVMLSSSCSMSEYGDPFSIMGASTRLHNDWHRAQLGWVTDVQTVTTSGVYTLAPAELASGSPKLIRVPRGDGTFLNLEFRQPEGSFDSFSSTDPAVTGVSIRIAPDLGTLVQSKLIDANPATSTFADAPFGVGRTLVDPVSGAAISTLSVGAAGATVSIQVTGDTQAPAAPGTLTASVKRHRVTVNWGAASDNVGVTGYRVFRNGVQVAQVAALSFRESPGIGTFTYTVKAVDAAGNVGPASNSVSVNV
jgi:Gametolysin peptidase M11